jgi:hypothetical protein
VDVLGALLLMFVMYILIPLAVVIATVVALGGAERLLPGGTRTRTVTPTDSHGDHH